MVGGAIRPDASPQGGRNSRCDSCVIEGSRLEVLSDSPDVSWSQLVTARCRVLMVGLRGREAAGTFSFVFCWPQSIRARTMRSCFDVVANAIRSALPVIRSAAVRVCYDRNTYSCQGRLPHVLSDHQTRLYSPIRYETHTTCHCSEAIALEAGHS